jgi:hypothetical protein
LYAADTGASHYPDAQKNIRVWDVVDGKKLANGREFASMNLEMADGAVKAGFADGIRADIMATSGPVQAGWVPGMTACMCLPAKTVRELARFCCRKSAATCVWGYEAQSFC